MTLQESLFSHLASHSGLTTLVGKRVYPVKLPQVDDPKNLDQFLPAVTYVQVTETPEHSLDARRLLMPMFQVSSWSRSYKQVNAVADEVTAALDGFQGQMGGAGGVDIQHMLLSSRGPELFEQETEIFQIPQDFEIFYRA